jgi:AcrR family transcriptional regulator
MLTQENDNPDRHEQILIAALQVFAENGYEKTTIAEVAKVAGIGKGTVYEYFENKEQLLCDTMFYYLDCFDPIIDQISRDIANEAPLEQLKEMLLRMACTYSKDPTQANLYPAFMEMMVRKPAWMKEAQFVEKCTEGIRTMMRSFIYAAVDSGDLPEKCRETANKHAINILAAFDGLMFDFLMSDDFFDLREQFSIFIDAYIGGMQAG